MNIWTDTCSTCNNWTCVSRQSKFGGCRTSTPDIIMERDDACGAHSPMEESIDPTETTIINTVLQEMTNMGVEVSSISTPKHPQGWGTWEDFYGANIQ